MDGAHSLDDGGVGDDDGEDCFARNADKERIQLVTKLVAFLKPEIE